MEINLGDMAFDIDFHPSDQLVATPLISGHLQVYRYASGSVPQRVVDVPAHKKSCRAARFINSGQAILTVSKDRSIVETDLETGSVKTFYENAHKKGINKLINLDEYTIATGDYGGCIKVWDIRQRSLCNKFKAHRAFVSDLAFAADSRRVLGTSGDGTLSICNLRMNKREAKSQLNEEPQSVVIMKNGAKVVCSSNEGTLFLYSQDGLEDSSNRFLGFQPYSIEAMLKLDEDSIITGSETGLISLVGILPNRIIQPIADHSENILGLAFSHDKKFLGSVADDEMLKLWDMDAIVTQDSGKTTADEMDVDSNLPKSGKGTKKKRAGKRNVMCSPNVFADLEIDG